MASWRGRPLFLLPLLFVVLQAKLVRPGLRPFRGWTSWDLSAVKYKGYGHDWLNSTNVLAQSVALQTTGLQAAGFDHINIDSFWSYNPMQSVDKWGRWMTNFSRFPDGMAPISKAVHARGQKFGLYINPGVLPAAVKQRSPIQGTNCTADMIALHDPKSSTGFVRANPFGDGYGIDWSHRCAKAYVQSCANLLAIDYGIDFLKIDAVSPGSANNNSTDWPEPPYNTYDNSRDIAEWSTALEATGRDVWLAISWEIDPNYASEFRDSANSWRTSMDIDCYCEKLVKWPAVKRVFAQVQPWVPYAGNNRTTGRPDCDSLNLGNSLTSFGNGLTDIEERTYATFWSIVGAPIFTGIDLTLLDRPLVNSNNNGSDTTGIVEGREEPADANRLTGYEMLTQPALTAINLHPITAVPDSSTINMSTHPLLQTWVTDYGNGSGILALFNLDDQARAMRWAAPKHRSFTATDVWAGHAPYHGADGKCGQGGLTGEVTLEAHGCLLLRLIYDDH